MKYLDAQWLHDFDDEPCRIVSEIGDDDYETRKLEFFRDGSVACAPEAKLLKRAYLGEVPIPSLDYINEQDEFEAVYITKEAFDTLWQQAMDIK